MTYQNNIPTRRALFQEERLLLDSCLNTLSDMDEDYVDIIRRCGPLSDTTKQSLEINEEDHGKAILVFTVVTIIFLPLSFVTSYLGMNTSDIRDMDNKQTLFWEIAIPLTAVTMGSILFIAYNGDELREHTLSIFRLLTGKKVTRKSDRGISVAQRKRASMFSDSASTFDYKSLADEAEFAPPKQLWQADTHYSAKLDEEVFLKGRSHDLLKPDPWISIDSQDYLVPEAVSHRSRSRSHFSPQHRDDYSSQPSYLTPDSTGLSGQHVYMKASSSPYYDGTSTSQRAEPYRPTYPRVHTQYMYEETLTHFNVPWEYDAKDPNYRILLRDIGAMNLEQMFEHTRTLRNRRKSRSGSERSRRSNPGSYDDDYDDRSRSRRGRDYDEDYYYDRSRRSRDSRDNYDDEYDERSYRDSGRSYADRGDKVIIIERDRDSFEPRSYPPPSNKPEEYSWVRNPSSSSRSRSDDRTRSTSDSRSGPPPRSYSRDNRRSRTGLNTWDENDEWYESSYDRDRRRDDGYEPEFVRHPPPSHPAPPPPSPPAGPSTEHGRGTARRDTDLEDEMRDLEEGRDPRSAARRDERETRRDEGPVERERRPYGQVDFVRERRREPDDELPRR